MARPDDPHAARPDERQLSELFAEVRGLVDDLELGILDNETRRRAKLTARDVMMRGGQPTRHGYPTPSMGGSRQMAVSDPVGRLTAAKADAAPGDPARVTALSMLRGVKSAVGDLRMARSALASATSPLLTGADEDPG